VVKYLELGEHLEADDGYMSLDPLYVKTKSGAAAALRGEGGEEMQNTLMARHETANKCIKQFGILSKRYDGDLAFHGKIFHAAEVTNKKSSISDYIMGRPLNEKTLEAFSQSTGTLSCPSPLSFFHG